MYNKMLLALATTLVMGATSLEAVPTNMSYQGRLTNAAGQVISQQVTMRFALYNSADVTGTNVKVWPLGDGYVTKTVVVTNGLYSVTLDDLSPELFNQDLWLEVQVADNTSSPEFETLSPRTQMTTTPYSYYAGTATKVIDNAITPAMINENVIGAGLQQDSDKKIELNTAYSNKWTANQIFTNIQIENENNKPIINSGQGTSKEGYLKTRNPQGDGTLVTLGSTASGLKGAVSVGNATALGTNETEVNKWRASMAYINGTEFPNSGILSDNWMVGTGDLVNQKGAVLLYDDATTATEHSTRIAVLNGTLTPTFTVDQEGDVVAKSVTINGNPAATEEYVNTKITGTADMTDNTYSRWDATKSQFVNGSITEDFDEDKLNITNRHLIVSGTVNGTQNLPRIEAPYISTPNYINSVNSDTKGGIRMGESAGGNSGWLMINDKEKKVVELGETTVDGKYGMQINNQSDETFRAGIGWNAATSAWTAGVGKGTSGAMLAMDEGNTSNATRIAVMNSGIPTFIVDKEGDVTAKSVTIDGKVAATEEYVNAKATTAGSGNFGTPKTTSPVSEGTNGNVKIYKEGAEAATISMSGATGAITATSATVNELTVSGTGATVNLPEGSIETLDIAAKAITAEKLADGIAITTTGDVTAHNVILKDEQGNTNFQIGTSNSNQGGWAKLYGDAAVDATHLPKELVVLGNTNGSNNTQYGAVSVSDGASDGAGMYYNTDPNVSAWVSGVQNNGNSAAAMATADGAKLVVMNGTTEKFSADQDGAVKAVSADFSGAVAIGTNDENSNATLKLNGVDVATKADVSALDGVANGEFGTAYDITNTDIAGKTGTVKVFKGGKTEDAKTPIITLDGATGDVTAHNVILKDDQGNTNFQIGTSNSNQGGWAKLYGDAEGTSKELVVLGNTTEGTAQYGSVSVKDGVNIRAGMYNNGTSWNVGTGDFGNNQGVVLNYASNNTNNETRIEVKNGVNNSPFIVDKEGDVTAHKGTFSGAGYEPTFEAALDVKGRIINSDVLNESDVPVIIGEGLAVAGDLLVEGSISNGESTPLKINDGLDVSGNVAIGHAAIQGGDAATELTLKLNGVDVATKADVSALGTVVAKGEFGNAYVAESIPNPEITGVAGTVKVFKGGNEVNPSITLTGESGAVTTTGDVTAHNVILKDDQGNLNFQIGTSNSNQGGWAKLYGDAAVDDTHLPKELVVLGNTTEGTAQYGSVSVGDGTNKGAGMYYDTDANAWLAGVQGSATTDAKLVVMNGTTEKFSADQDGAVKAVTATISGATTLSGELTVNSNVILGSDANNTIALKGTVFGNVVPSFDDAYNLGCSANRWKSIYVGPGSINIGTATHNATITYSGTSTYMTIDKDLKLGALNPAHSSEDADLALSGNLEVLGTIYGEFAGNVEGTTDKAKSLDGNVVGTIPYQGGSPVVTQYLAPDPGKLLVSGATKPEYKSVSDALAGQSVSGMVLTGGSIDGTAIGAVNESTGKFSTLTATNITIGNVLPKANIAKNLDIDGGTIKNTIIGASNPAAATFTDLTVSGTVTFATPLTDDQVANNLTINGGSITNSNISGIAGSFATLTVTGNTILGTANGSNTITVNGVMTPSGTGRIEANSLKTPFVLSDSKTGILFEVINDDGGNGKAAHFKGSATDVAAVEIEHALVGNNALKLVQGDLEIASGNLDINLGNLALNSGSALISNPSANGKEALKVVQNSAEAYGILVTNEQTEPEATQLTNNLPLAYFINASDDGTESATSYGLVVANINPDNISSTIYASHSGSGSALKAESASGLAIEVPKGGVRIGNANLADGDVTAYTLPTAKTDVNGKVLTANTNGTTSWETPATDATKANLSGATFTGLVTANDGFKIGNGKIVVSSIQTTKGITTPEATGILDLSTETASMILLPSSLIGTDIDIITLPNGEVGQILYIVNNTGEDISANSATISIQSGKIATFICVDTDNWIKTN